MNEEVSWHIGKEDDGSRLDKPPFKAYFYWKSHGRVNRSAEFTKAELEAEIARLREEGKDSSAFEAAL